MKPLAFCEIEPLCFRSVEPREDASLAARNSLAHCELVITDGLELLAQARWQYLCQFI